MKPNLHDKVSSCSGGLSLVSLMLLVSPQSLMIPSNISRLAWSLSDFLPSSFDQPLAQRRRNRVDSVQRSQLANGHLYASINRTLGATQELGDLVRCQGAEPRDRVR